MAICFRRGRDEISNSSHSYKVRRISGTLNTYVVLAWNHITPRINIRRMVIFSRASREQVYILSSAYYTHLEERDQGLWCAQGNSCWTRNGTWGYRESVWVLKGLTLFAFVGVCNATWILNIGRFSDGHFIWIDYNITVTVKRGLQGMWSLELLFGDGRLFIEAEYIQPLKDSFSYMNCY
jgi:hypothetical protein